MSKQRHPGVVLAAVCVSLTAITMNLSLLNVGIPTLSRELGASNTGLQWIVDGYSLVFAGFLLAAGSLGDRLGRRDVMAAGLVIFGVFSALAALSKTTDQLIAARSGMGLGAAFVMPMTLSILTDIYPTEAGLRRAMGIWAATASAGAVIAPLIAGVLLKTFWWGSLFLVNVPIALSVAVVVMLTVPNSAPRRDTRLDWAGVVLSILLSASLVFALIEGPERGWGDPLVLGSLLGSVASTLLFCVWELRCPHPLIDIRCFRLPRFSVGCVVVGLQYFFSFGVSFVVTQYLQLVLGLSALAAGTALVPAAAAVMIAAPIGARAFGRFGARSMIAVSLLILALGTGLMTLADVNSSVVPMLVSLILVNMAIGLMAPGTTSMVMSAVPPDKAGMASGTQSTTRQLGGALGVAALGSLLASRYSANLVRMLTGTAAARYLPEATKSLAAALQAAPPGTPSHALVTTASKQAFVEAIHVVALTITVSAAVCAAVVYFTLGGLTASEDAPLEEAVDAGAGPLPSAPALSPDEA
jgi:EmrB/QacA subfamily drug resistance transporter